MRHRFGRQHEQQFLLAERVRDEPGGKRQVSGAELAGSVLDERSYAVGALGFVDADLDPGVEFAEPADRSAIGSTASVASAAISSRPVFSSTIPVIASLASSIARST